MTSGCTHQTRDMRLLVTASEAAEALAVDAKTLAAALQVSIRNIRSMDAGGRLPRPLRLNGRSVRWVLDGPHGIRAWLAAGAPKRSEFEARVNVEKRLPGNGKPRKERA